MAREKEGYRDNIEYIKSKTTKEMLGIADVARITGMTRPSVKKHIKFNDFGKITLPDLVRQERRG